MGDIVKLRSSPIDDLASDLGCRFVTDCCRAGEGLISDKEVQEKYEISDADWHGIAKDKALGKAIRAERERRLLNGVAAREAAARRFIKAPAILDGIMSDANSNPRHKIEAIRELRTTASVGSEKGPAQGENFSIVINLGNDHVEKYEVELNQKPQLDLERDNDDQWG